MCQVTSGRFLFTCEGPFGMSIDCTHIYKSLCVLCQTCAGATQIN